MQTYEQTSGQFTSSGSVKKSHKPKHINTVRALHAARDSNVYVVL